MPRAKQKQKKIRRRNWGLQAETGWRGRKYHEGRGGDDENPEAGSFTIAQEERENRQHN